MGIKIVLDKFSHYPWLVFFLSLVGLTQFLLEDKYIEIKTIENQIENELKRLDFHKALLANKSPYSRQLMVLQQSQETMMNYFGKKDYEEIRSQLEYLVPEMEISHIKNYQETEFHDNDVHLTRFRGTLTGSLLNVRKTLWELSTSGNFSGPLVRPVSVMLKTNDNEVYLMFVFDVVGYSNES